MACAIDLGPELAAGDATIVASDAMIVADDAVIVASGAASHFSFVHTTQVLIRHGPMPWMVTDDVFEWRSLLALAKHASTQAVAKQGMPRQHKGDTATRHQTALTLVGAAREHAPAAHGTGTTIRAACVWKISSGRSHSFDPHSSCPPCKYCTRYSRSQCTP